MGLHKDGLGNPKPGDAITADRAQAINQAIRGFMNSSARGDYFNPDLGILGRQLPNVPMGFELGIIKDVFPSSPLTDARYVVQRAALSSEFDERQVRPAEFTSEEITRANPSPIDGIFGVDATAEVNATNLSEFIIGSPGGPHLLPVGTPVLLWVFDFPVSGTEVNRHWFFFTQPQSWFRVSCVVAGGVAGDDTTDCTFNYEVTSLHTGLVLAPNVLPERRRLPKTTHLTESSNGAADDTSFGMAYFDGSSLRLDFVINELPETTTCS